MKWIIAIFFTSFPLPLLAELNVFFSPSEIPTIVAENNAPLRLVWKDGREAISVKRRTPPVTAKVPFVIHENSCTEITTSNCYLQTSFQAYELRMKWAKHSNPTKIGQLLRLKSKTSPDVYDFIPISLFMTPIDHIRSPILSRDIPHDELHCDDYKFFSQDPFSGTPIRISRWENEAMGVNPETNRMENRSIGGAFDVELEPINNSLRLQVRGGYVSYANMITLTSADVINWTLKDKSQNLCEIGLKPDQTNFNVVAAKYFEKLPDVFDPYIFGSDEASPLFVPQLKNILENQETYEVE
ncbi:MAG: hypothetical protein AABY64_07710 [Bdellovibrionota bacterium]